MKTFATTIAALVLAAGAANSQELLCEREHTFFDEGQLVDTDTLTFYAHGCDRFQYRDIGLNQAASLLSAGLCSIEASASGGCGQGAELNEDGECVAIIEVQVEEEFQIPAVTEEVAIPRGEFRGTASEFRLTAEQGSNTIRVSRPDGRALELRRSGNTLLSIPAGQPGVGHFDLPAGRHGGVKIHDTNTGADLRPQSTVSTNGSFWSGSWTETIEVSPASTGTRTVTETQTVVTAPREGADFANQPGPRTERCAPLGGVVAPLR